MGIIKTVMVTFDSDKLAEDKFEEFVNDIDINEEDISVAYSGYRVCPIRTAKGGGELMIDTTVVIMKTGHRFILDIHKEDFDNKRRLCQL